MTVAGLLVVTVVVGTLALSTLVNLSNGIHRSPFTLPGGVVAQNQSETNILVMGLDSRLDENGKALPAAVYDALHAGTQADGGYNANVLMLIHIPAGGGKAVGISIPRDDYVALSSSPDGVQAGKIKQAYGLALDEKLRQLRKSATTSASDAYQQARAAGRQAEIATVSTFLGGVPINHFVEVTMAAFYQSALALQPITVCLNENTQDAYSGANFHAGMQQLNASQAVSFVRQRRDTHNPNLNFSDLDRERRQQAFIVSLAYKMKQANTFTNFDTLRALMDTTTQNIAVDSGFDLLSLASQGSKIAGGNISFSTLPITAFAVKGGQAVNLVDVAQVRSVTAQLLAAIPPTAAPSSSTTSKATIKPPTSPAPEPSSTTPHVYSDWTSPLQSGSIPCVK